MLMRTPVYLSPWTQLEKGTVGDPSFRTTWSSCSDPLLWPNLTTSSSLRSSCSRKGSNMRRVSAENWLQFSTCQSKLLFHRKRNGAGTGNNGLVDIMLNFHTTTWAAPGLALGPGRMTCQAILHLTWWTWCAGQDSHVVLIPLPLSVKT